MLEYKNYIVKGSLYQTEATYFNSFPLYAGPRISYNFVK